MTIIVVRRKHAPKGASVFSVYFRERHTHHQRAMAFLTGKSIVQCFQGRKCLQARLRSVLPGKIHPEGCIFVKQLPVA